MIVRGFISHKTIRKSESYHKLVFTVKYNSRGVLEVEPRGVHPPSQNCAPPK